MATILANVSVSYRVGSVYADYSARTDTDFLFNARSPDLALSPASFSATDINAAIRARIVDDAGALGVTAASSDIVLIAGAM